MVFTKKAALCSLALMFISVAAFGQTEIKGKLIKATKNGADISGLFEPIVSVFQEEVLGIKTLKVSLTGIRPYNSKTYEFYYDGKDESTIVWKRRMRGVVVRPICVYITVGETEDSNILYLNYEYKDSKGFGSVDYIISTEKE
ncbi:MAG: hypothetical protein LBG72_06840 [Spirochaetaceae bacterium]|jgi:hypothetical protein|nr:hypothetical protein [Spirochaetaceae bacterium]